MNYKKVEEFIKQTNREKLTQYAEYWTSIPLTTDMDYYNRWLLSILSVRTRWQANIAAYLEVKKLGTDYTRDQLLEALKKGGCGLWTMRLRGIYDLNNRFWAMPNFFRPIGDETLVQCRNRLMPEITGLGLAKISFPFEMMFPVTCDVVCLDTHILQLYEWDVSKGVPRLNDYLAMENHWISTCKAHDMASALVRAIYWDFNVQQQDNSRYWSYVLEK